MTHPLTDEMCGDIAENLPDYNVENCMRAAYDKGIQACIDWLLNYPETGMFPPSPEWLGEELEKQLLVHRDQ